MSEYYDPLLKPAERMRLIKLFRWGLFLTLSVFVYGATLSNASHQAPKNAPAVIQTEAIDPRILAISQRVGISETNLKIAHTRIGSIPGQEAKSALELSIYSQSTQTIYIYPVIFSYPVDRQTSVVSHEYLHWVWQTKVSNKAAFCADLMTYYSRPPVQYRMQAYQDLVPGSEDFCTELHSILGTEMRDSEMNPNLVKWYSQWLPNRNALPNYF